tara:strand:- start:187 stop:573 length:387 start_codon:yes stop_codon:yes gene_type:complete
MSLEKEWSKNIFQHYLTKGIDHNFDNEEWEQISDTIIEDIHDGDDQFSSVVNCFFGDGVIHCYKESIEFFRIENSGNQILYKSDFGGTEEITFYSEEIKFVFWCVLNNVLKQNDSKEKVESLWQLGEN